ncbi:4-hydroxy-3-methylbut-2-enyl diphosphate reductase [Candidatus Palauibacter sp.]|uniref:4-hydroxy-3-methylbut-2-enyl diphosphate reductase n=1 Tax=Candidatus Palauibacter sp. TaxID=3101350 RepID=UPI003B5CA458
MRTPCVKAAGSGRSPGSGQTPAVHVASLRAPCHFPTMARQALGQAGRKAAPGEERYFRRGLGLKKEIQPVLDFEYGSALVALIRARDFELRVNRLHLRLAKSFGFCYGVDRAVDYAYESRRKFPDRRIFLVGEIIHNPHVNRRLEEMEIEFLYPDEEGEFDFSSVTPEDVVIIPAFGVTLHDFETLRALNCILIDTTCGSVLNVWKRVESYAREGFTTVVHGKYWHEETRTTSSQVNKYDGAKFLIVRDMAQAQVVCSYIRGDGDRADFMELFDPSRSPGFDPDRDLGRIGVANQTTMLASESLSIAAQLGEAMSDRWGPEELPNRFRSFDTICSATQKRQDAVKEMMEAPPDLMIVIGGYNSSNTNQLAHLCSLHTKTYHVEDATCIDTVRGRITHKRIGGDEILTEDAWLPSGEVEIGLTAGASTPDSKLGEAVERIIRGAGYDPSEVLGTA